MSTKVPCKKCKGTGTVTLSVTLSETLALVHNGRSQKDGVEASGVHSVLCMTGEDVSLQNVHNRLRKLREMGLIERTGSARAWRYRVVQPKPRKPDASTGKPRNRRG